MLAERQDGDAEITQRVGVARFRPGFLTRVKVGKKRGGGNGGEGLGGRGMCRRRNFWPVLPERSASLRKTTILFEVAPKVDYSITPRPTFF